MKIRTSDDNKYKIGTYVTTVENPGVNLVILSYSQRIYYCETVIDPQGKHKAYFEKEIQQIEKSDSSPLFMPAVPATDFVSAVVKK
jgi:hypothetical protein